VLSTPLRTRVGKPTTFFRIVTAIRQLLPPPLTSATLPLASTGADLPPKRFAVAAWRLALLVPISPPFLEDLTLATSLPIRPMKSSRPGAELRPSAFPHHRRFHDRRCSERCRTSMANHQSARRSRQPHMPCILMQPGDSVAPVLARPSYLTSHRGTSAYAMVRGRSHTRLNARHIGFTATESNRSFVTAPVEPKRSPTSSGEHTALTFATPRTKIRYAAPAITVCLSTACHP
jgi:hypothetical protein